MAEPILPLALETVARGSQDPIRADIADLMLQFILQLAVILIAARLGGSFFRRYLRLPRILGELTMGLIIGPYALGGIAFLGYGPLFPLPAGLLPVSSELYAVATLGSVILLFLSGLEMDVTMFLRYSLTGSIVGICGVIFSFVLGDVCAVWFGMADSFMDPPALFLGTISTATSIGITARCLSEKRKTASPEGVTTMTAAVLDDVVGIVLLAIVVKISHMDAHGDSLAWGEIGSMAAKAFGFWLLCMTLTMLTAKRVSRLLKISHTPSTIASLSLGLALLLAGLSEMAGLAMIIGAYIAGLALSQTDLAHFLQEQLHGLYMVFVPTFFCVMGMLVDFSSMGGVVVFGLVYSALAILSKIVGCGLPAMWMKFNLRGATRVGLGMLPRGEVALIVAGLGYSSGIIQSDLFGVSVMMTMITTLIAPPLLMQSLSGPSGLRGAPEPTEEKGLKHISLDFPSTEIAEFFRSRIIRAFRDEQFFVHRLHRDDGRAYQICKDDLNFTLVQHGTELMLNLPPQSQHVARKVVHEQLLSLQDLIESCRKMKGLEALEQKLAKDLDEKGS